MGEKTLQQLYQDLGTENFNDLVITQISGDEHFIHDSLIPPEQLNPLLGYDPQGFWEQNYIEKLQAIGYNQDNFPYEELQEYCNKVEQHLKTNLILNF